MGGGARGSGCPAHTLLGVTHHHHGPLQPEGWLSWRKSGVSHVCYVYWRPQLILKISQLFKT